jgi:hypothetical protein
MPAWRSNESGERYRSCASMRAERAWFAWANQSDAGRKTAQPSPGRHSSRAIAPEASASAMKHAKARRRVSVKTRIPSSTLRAVWSARRWGHSPRKGSSSGSVSKKFGESAKPASLSPTTGNASSGQPAAMWARSPPVGW